MPRPVMTTRRSARRIGTLSSSKRVVARSRVPSPGGRPPGRSGPADSADNPTGRLDQSATCGAASCGCPLPAPAGACSRARCWALARSSTPSNCWVNTKFFGPKIWLARELSRWAKTISTSASSSPSRKALPSTTAPSAPQVGQGHLVDELVAGAGDAEELGAGDLGQDDLLGEPARLADQDPAGLGQPLDDQRGRHHRVAREVVVQVLLGQGQVLDGPGELAAAELQELVDPDPSHRRQYPPGVRVHPVPRRGASARCVARAAVPTRSASSRPSAATIVEPSPRSGWRACSARTAPACRPCTGR